MTAMRRTAPAFKTHPTWSILAPPGAFRSPRVLRKWIARTRATARQQGCNLQVRNCWSASAYFPAERHLPNYPVSWLR